MIFIFLFTLKILKKSGNPICMEKFFLTLLTFAEELNIVDNQRIDGSELALKTG